MRKFIRNDDQRMKSDLCASVIKEIETAHEKLCFDERQRIRGDEVEGTHQHSNACQKLKRTEILLISCRQHHP